MYNQVIIDRINNLNNLCALKNANAKAISKNNEFGDIVKFFARIDVNNVIEKMSFKATGCTTFIALCSYFCEIAEGKTIDDALKINDKQLSKFTQLDEPRQHVYKIIIDTFALLVKKYRVALSKGTVVPVPATITIDLNSGKDKEKLEKNNDKQKKSVKNTKNNVVNDDLKEILMPKSEKSKSKSKKSEKIVVEDKSETKEIEKTESVEISKEKIEENKNANENKLNHLNALNNKLQTKEKNEKVANNSKALSEMLNKIKKTENKEDKATKNDPEVIIDETPKKKSLFSWFFKK